MKSKWFLYAFCQATIIWLHSSVGLERRANNAEVLGSIPNGATIVSFYFLFILDLMFMSS